MSSGAVVAAVGLRVRVRTPRRIRAGRPNGPRGTPTPFDPPIVQVSRRRPHQNHRLDAHLLSRPIVTIDQRRSSVSDIDLLAPDDDPSARSPPADELTRRHRTRTPRSSGRSPSAFVPPPLRSRRTLTYRCGSVTRSRSSARRIASSPTGVRSRRCRPRSPRDHPPRLAEPAVAMPSVLQRGKTTTAPVSQTVTPRTWRHAPPRTPRGSHRAKRQVDANQFWDRVGVRSAPRHCGRR